MPEAPVSVPQPQEVAPAATGPASTEAKPDDRVERLEQTVSMLQRTLNGLAAQKRVQEKQAQPADPEQQNLTLRSLKAELDGRDAKLRDRAIRTEIDAFCKEAGVPESARPFVKSYIREQHGAQLTVDENDQVLYTDEFGEKKPFSDLGKKVLASSQAFLPATPTPGQVGGRVRPGAANVQGAKPVEAWNVEDWTKNPEQGLAALRAGYRRQQGM